jgi:hypothetical protein
MHGADTAALAATAILPPGGRRRNEDLWALRASCLFALVGGPFPAIESAAIW